MPNFLKQQRMINDAMTKQFLRLSLSFYCLKQDSEGDERGKVQAGHKWCETIIQSLL
jgi:hypothetical protein